MVRVGAILDIIETALWTGYIAKEKPLSVMLISSVGSGKSEILRKSYKPPEITVAWGETKDEEGNPKKERKQSVKHIGSVLYTTDSTPYVLYHRYGELLKSGQIKHIVIPDFLSILTKSKDAMPDTIRFYNSLIEEGICRIESKYSDFITEIPLQIGLMTAVSFQDYAARSKSQNWGALGFLSRVLPVSYRYSNNTKEAILKSTFLREYHNEINFELRFPDVPIQVDLPDKYREEVTELAKEIKDPSDDSGARRCKQVMTFVMALSLKDGRDVTTQEDVDKLMELSRFFNAGCETEL